jgi:hypothetical protein
MNKPVCELPKNSRAVTQFRLGEYRGHKFIDMRIFALEDGNDPAPTKKGLAVSPILWQQFKATLAQVEAAMLEQADLSLCWQRINNGEISKGKTVNPQGRPQGSKHKANVH